MKNIDWHKYLETQAISFVLGNLLLISALIYSHIRGFCLIIIPRSSPDMAYPCGDMTNIFVNFLVLEVIFIVLLLLGNFPSPKNPKTERERQFEKREMFRKSLIAKAKQEREETEELIKNWPKDS